jgi:outer membrane protein assembly factor BamE (lipoprotein component of BamABCDE complex)
MLKTKCILLAALLSVIVSACSATRHSADVRASQDGDRLTVGIVQREIRLGMSAAEVALVLGSPNIVTSDKDRQESWIYDRISTDVAYSRSDGSIVGLIFGSSGGGAGVGSVSTGASSTSQRTLTVVVRFDRDSAVRNFSYHTSRF